MKNVLTGVIVSAMMTIGLTGTAMAQEDDEATRRADAQQRLEEAAREIAEISGAMAMDQVVKIVERFRITDGGAVLGVFIGCLEDNGKRRHGGVVAPSPPGGAAEKAAAGAEDSPEGSVVADRVLGVVGAGGVVAAADSRGIHGGRTDGLVGVDEGEAEVRGGLPIRRLEGLDRQIDRQSEQSQQHSPAE